MQQTLILEYIWIGGNSEIRSKTKVLKCNHEAKVYLDHLLGKLTIDYYNAKYFTLPDWNFDGSSTNQASGNDSEVVLKPKKVYKNPFSNVPDSYLVLCETYLPAGRPHSTVVPASTNTLVALIVRQVQP